MVRNRLRARLVGKPGESPFYPVYLTVSATANRDRGARRRRFFLRHIEIGLQDLRKLMAKPAVPAPSSAAPASSFADAPSLIRPVSADPPSVLRESSPTPAPTHPDAEFVIVNVGVGMKFPDVFPTDYAMCEVRLDVAFVARRGDELGEAKRMFERIGPHVQSTLGDIARAAGGTVPFITPEAAAAATLGADVKKS